MSTLELLQLQNECKNTFFERGEDYFYCNDIKDEESKESKERR